MDSTQLNTLVENTYIPSKCNKDAESALKHHHHPSLVMLDKQTDTTHHLQCGCCGGCCISEQAWWQDPKQAEARCVAARTQGYNSSPNSVAPSPVISASTSSNYLATSSGASKRPEYNRSISNTSVLCLDSNSSR